VPLTTLGQKTKCAYSHNPKLQIKCVRKKSFTLKCQAIAEKNLQ